MTEYLEAVESGPEWLAAGGFAPDTAVMTTDGPVRVASLEPGMVVYALAPSTRVVKRKRVVVVDAVDPGFGWTCLSGKRFDFRVLSDHRVLYRTRSVDRPRFRRAGDLGAQTGYRFVNAWLRQWGGSIAQVDFRKWVDEYCVRVGFDGHGQTFRAALPEGCEPVRGCVRDGFFFDAETFRRFEGDLRAIGSSVGLQAGRGHRCQPVVVPGTAWLELLGWYATEGSVTWKSDRESGEVRIAQSDAERRSEIASVCAELGISARETEDAVRFGSVLIGGILEGLCGSGSRQKRLPEFVFGASTAQVARLRDVLLAGDGNAQGTFYTTSSDLRDGLLRLCVATGVKPRFTQRGDVWQVYVRTGNDGFRSDEHLGRYPANRPAYRLAVEDYGTVLAGRNGKFQWIGVSGVA